jgi:two-component system, chemotaxis family, chemotaxis protein CheY
VRALVVDDSRAMRTILKKILAELGFETLEAGHGLEGLERLQETSDVDVALVDWNMPEMDGLAFVKAVRGRSDSARAVPLLMVTSEIEMSRVKSALDEGANEYLMKPFTKEMLADKLRLMHLVG